MNKDILLCGVGGQGTVLAARLIAAAAMNAGEIVHSAETIGMAQRGGSVTSHVRIGEKALSPLIPYGSAELILAFEPSEAVRNLRYLKNAMSNQGSGGTVIVNKVPVKPASSPNTITDDDANEWIKYLVHNAHKVIAVDSDAISKEAGSPKCFNVAVLGIAAGAGCLPFSEDNILDAIKCNVQKRFMELNCRAYNIGVKIGSAYANK